MICPLTHRSIEQNTDLSPRAYYYTMCSLRETWGVVPPPSRQQMGVGVCLRGFGWAVGPIYTVYTVIRPLTHYHHLITHPSPPPSYDISPHPLLHILNK